MSGSRLDPSVSVIVPMKDEAGSVRSLVEQIERELAGRSFEIVLVDDGSQDGTTEQVAALCQEATWRKGIVLRRNFGKAAALRAGFDVARGDLIFTIDGDLQDDPSEMSRFLQAIEDGADMVVGWKTPRRDPLSKRLPSILFNRIIAISSGLRLHDLNCGFKCFRREILDEIELYGELHRFIPVLAYARGFRVVEIPVRHHPRRSGHSKFGASRLPKGFFDLLTVLLTTRYFYRPLHYFGAIGLPMFFAGACILAYLTGSWLAGRWIESRPLFFLGILLTLLGVQIVLTGLVAEMVAKTNSRTQRGYAVKRRLNCE
ncbi:MAG: Undecaprenyl-phosphate 4-deoxy-4-formamido-L-arabinose transferase [candidate division BRC1 bacterium ADurb.BinA364]|nr:MAG: Undecaprenyl-phosphate 4-deoxy-4-formamido-L-arabinose transferase [candidate division BRC1 bacterium ADurb.BinA364]